MAGEVILDWLLSSEKVNAPSIAQSAAAALVAGRRAELEAAKQVLTVAGRRAELEAAKQALTDGPTTAMLGAWIP